MCRERAKILLLLLFGFGAALRGSSETLEIVREMKATGSKDAAIVAYRAWMSENENDDLYVRAAIELSALLDDLNERHHVLSDALGIVEDPTDRHDALRALAIVAESLGDLALAQQLFREASFAVPDEKDFESLLDSALISFELGQYRNAEAQARVIMETVKDSRLRMGGAVLLSRIYYANDRDDDAINLLVDFTEAETELDAPGLYWLFRLATMMERRKIAVAAIGQLETRYSDSLEAALIRGEVRRMPTPSALLEATARDVIGVDQSDRELISTTAQESPPEPDQESRTGTRIVQIQTGSFTVKENAEYAAADLRGAGFATSIEERVVSETLYYRVVVPDVAEDKINTMLLELKEEGFEGYPVYD